MLRGGTPRWPTGRRAPLLALGGALLGLLVLFGSQVAERATLTDPHPTPILFDRNGAFLAQVGNGEGVTAERRLDYGYWPLADLPPRVVAATLTREDRRFWSHPGVDALALARALRQNLFSGRRVSGASTVAMQVARMQHPAARTLWAKAVEAGTAVALSLRYGREAVLRHYLRLVPFGNGSHGIAHAARFYLDKPVDDLSWAEIALLSAVPQSPTRLNPLRPDGLRRAMRRGHLMLDELGRQGVIAPVQLALAHRQLDDIRLAPVPRRPEALHALVRFEGMAERGQLVAAKPSDPRIRTSLDLDIQARVNAHAQRFLTSWRGAGAEQVAVMVVKRDTREVLAAIGSGGYGGRHAGAVDFTRVARSPGSTLKPFIYGLALERGLLRTSDVMADLPDGASGIGNADGLFLGPMLPRQALANSRNVPATNLLREIGLDGLSLFPRPRAARSRRAGRELRIVDGDRLLADQPGTTDARLWRGGG